MDEQKDIIIQRYLDNDLSESERADFERQVQSDPELAETLKVYQSLVKGVQSHERAKMKAFVAGIGSQMTPGDMEDYSPKKPPKPNGGGSSIGGILRSLFFFLAVMGIAFFALIYFEQFPIEHPAVEKIEEKIKQLEEGSTYRVDTIYQVIETDKITRDTTFYDEEEAKEFLKKLDEGEYN